MKKDYIQIIIFIVLIALIIYGQIIFNKTSSPDDELIVVDANCHLNLKECVFSKDDMILTVSTEGKIQTLKPFVIKIKDQSSRIEQALVDLSMVDMDMGKNQFVFEKLNSTEWQASVVIPVCTTGRRDWQVDLRIKTSDKNYLMRSLIQL